MMQREKHKKSNSLKNEKKLHLRVYKIITSSPKKKLPAPQVLRNKRSFYEASLVESIWMMLKLHFFNLQIILTGFPRINWT